MPLIKQMFLFETPFISHHSSAYELEEELELLELLEELELYNSELLELLSTLELELLELIFYLLFY